MSVRTSAPGPEFSLRRPLCPRANTLALQKPDNAKRIALVMLPGARQPARVGMEHTALKLTDPSLLRMVAAGRQGELVGSVTPQRATRPIGTRIVLLRVATRPRGEPFCPQAR